jgi:hypothetical protein
VPYGNHPASAGWDSSVQILSPEFNEISEREIKKTTDFSVADGSPEGSFA